MRIKLVLIAALMLATPLQAGLLDAPAAIRGGTEVVVALDLSAGAIPRGISALSLAAKASETVLIEQLTGFAADTGIDLTAPISLVVAGPRGNPNDALMTGRLKVDIAKLLAVIKPMASGLKLEIKETNGGVAIGDKFGALFLKEGSFAVGKYPAINAVIAGTGDSPEAKAIADDLTTRAGANPTFALLMRMPEGLPGQPPPPAAVGGSQLAGFWPRFRGVFAACRVEDFAIDVLFDSPDAAQAAEPIIAGWIKVLEGQLSAEEARAKTAAAENGPFKNLDPKWVGARLSVENFRHFKSLLRIKADGPALTFSLPRDAIAGGTSVMTTTAVIGVLAAIAVPNFKAARERANWRACYANQKTIAGAVEMYNLDKNKRPSKLDPAFWEELKTGGYLASLPSDPGQGEGTTANYYLVETGNGIACKMHGSVQQDIKGELTPPGAPADVGPSNSGGGVDGMLRGILNKK